MQVRAPIKENSHYADEHGNDKPEFITNRKWPGSESVSFYPEARKQVAGGTL
jgi:hypothetical protein